MVKKNIECQIMWIEIEGKSKIDSLILGGIYSPCENIAKMETIKKVINCIETDLKELKELQLPIIMVGDMNVHVGNDKEGIKNNHQKI